MAVVGEPAFFVADNVELPDQRGQLSVGKQVIARWFGMPREILVGGLNHQECSAGGEELMSSREQRTVEIANAEHEVEFAWGLEARFCEVNDRCGNGYAGGSGTLAGYRQADGGNVPDGNVEAAVS